MSFDDFFHIYASVSPEERNRIEGMIDNPQEISAAKVSDFGCACNIVRLDLQAQHHSS